MKLRFLGTGSALVRTHLHTSFFVEWDGGALLVDTLGGYDIVRALRAQEKGIADVRTLFVTHRHTDHALGFVWLVRLIWQAVRVAKLPADYRLTVLCSPALRDILIRGTEAFIPDYYSVAKEYLEFVDLVDGIDIPLPSAVLTPVDLQSTKAEQFAFVLRAQGKTVVYSGDERLVPERFGRARGCDVLVTQAACLAADEETYQAHAKHQATVREAATGGAMLEAGSLVITHTADEGADRQERFRLEAGGVYAGPVAVPEDGETLAL